MNGMNIINNKPMNKSQLIILISQPRSGSSILQQLILGSDKEHQNLNNGLC